MVYLAQVKTHTPPQQLSVAVLARQVTDGKWAVESHTEQENITVSLLSEAEAQFWPAGTLVLLELDANFNCANIQDALPQLLQGLNVLTAPSPLSDPQNIEQWRQELTLKSQEMSMKMLELASRRERLEAEEAELASRHEHLKAEEAELDRERQHLAIERAQQTSESAVKE
ncbi:MAG: hypothetical protein AAGG51_12430 [Cyanobacteria bacterium P01_G01_bin.54]